MYADGAMVRQLLDNLIGNAVKYVVPGEVAHVTVTGRRVGDLVEVTVADEGIGIPADQRDQIFEAFHRATRADGVRRTRHRPLGVQADRRAPRRPDLRAATAR